MPMLFLSQRCQSVRSDEEAPPGGLAGRIGTGGAYRDRTDDPLLAKQVLSPLS